MDFAKVINELIDHMDGNSWSIHGFEPHPDLSDHQEQETGMETLPIEYVSQQGCDDYGFSGTIFFPTEYTNGDGGKLYLQVSFYC